MYILKLALLSHLFVCFLLFPSKLSAQPLFTENPIVFGKVKTKSWKSRRDEGIVKQSLDFSCGAASLATLLNNFGAVLGRVDNQPYGGIFGKNPRLPRQKCSQDVQSCCAFFLAGANFSSKNRFAS